MSRWARVTLGAISSLAIVLGTAPRVARAQSFCPANVYYDPGTTPSFMVDRSIVSGDLPSCSLLGDTCPVGAGAMGICEQLGSDATMLTCVPRVPDRALFWSCEPGCTCPERDDGAPPFRNVTVDTSGGPMCVCLFVPDSAMRNCSMGPPTLRDLLDCHSRGGKTGARVLTPWSFGDCDHDSVPNGCELPSACDPCADIRELVPTCAMFDATPPPVCRGLDAGAPDAGLSDADAGVAPRMDAGSSVTPPSANAVFHGGGGVVCSATGGPVGRSSALGSGLLAAAALLLAARARRR